MQQGNYQGLFIILKYLVNRVCKKYTFWSKCPPEISRVASSWFRQKAKIAQKGQHNVHGVPLILTKSQKRVNRVFKKHIKVIIRDYLSILVYQVDHFVKKSTI